MPAMPRLRLSRLIKLLSCLLLGLCLSGIGLPLVALNPPVTVAVASAPAASLSGQALELFWQGYQLFQNQQVEAAIAPWQQALTLYQQAQNVAGERSTLSALGAAYLNLEDYGQAIAHLEQFLSRVEAGDRPEAERLAQAQVLSNLGVAYRETGLYARAVAAQEQALSLMQSLGAPYQAATGQVLGNLGNAYAAVGDYNAAIQSHQQALAIVQAQNDAVGEAETLSNLGLLYANEGDYDEAIAQYQQSLVRLEALGSQPEAQYHETQAHLLLNMASAYHAKSDLDLAEVYYRQSLALAQEMGDRSLEVMALGSLGMVQEERGDLEGAIAMQRQSLQIVSTLSNPRLEATVQNNLGHTLYNQGDYREAEDLLRQAIAHLESLRPGLADLDNVALFDSQVSSYNLLQQILVARGRYEAALEVSEQGRARAFAELLARRSNPDSQPEVGLLPPTVEEIRAIARRQNATLVEYAIVADQAFRFQGRQRGREAELLVWVVSPSGSVAFRRVDLQPLWEQNRSSNSLTNLVASSRLSLGVRGEATDEADATSFNWPKLQQLHEYLITPIEDLLPANPTDPVIIIPQDALFLVPFAALQDADGRYLIERHTLLTAPSIQVIGLAQSQQRNRDTAAITDALTSVLLVGNPTMPAVSSKPGDPPEPLAPLPGSEKEAQDISRLLDVPALLGAQATEVTVRERMPSARIIHLATHGLLNYGQTQQGRGRDVPGAIALAPTQPISPASDGLLTTAEILSLRLNADLVVLSACNTGRGEITGDGVIGLSRSFISAGAASIIVSLWAVSDTSTAFVMTHFYENLREGQGKAQALRQAMLDAKDEYNHPFDWAAFTLIGEAQ